jgi:hypothetical protein
MTRTYTPLISHLARAALGCLLGASALPLAGCNILGPAIFFVKGPDKQPAAFELDPTKATVIVIDDKANIVPQRSLREVIGRTAEQDLLSQKKVTTMISSSQALGVLARERFGERMTIDEVGKALKADVVIYVAMDDFALTQDGQSISPLSRLRLKVVNVADGGRLFPAPAAGAAEWFELRVTLPAQSMERPTGAALMQANQDLARITGEQLAKVFYEHIPDAPTRLRDRE